MPRFVPPSKWRKLAKNAWKTDLGVGLLEIVIVEMPDEEYRKFRSSARGAKKYINDHKYLKKPTREVVFTKRAPARWKEAPIWIVVLTHTVDSTVHVIAAQK